MRNRGGWPGGVCRRRRKEGAANYAGRRDRARWELTAPLRHGGRGVLQGDQRQGAADGRTNTASLSAGTCG
eukprot:7220084-Pyramimonas_sp.AAC.1